MRWHGFTTLLLCLLVCAGCGAQAKRSGADTMLDTSDLSVGRGSLVLHMPDRKPLQILSYTSSQFDPESGPVWFVMHGASRAAQRYLDAAAPAAERYGALVLVPHFDKATYPSNQDYTFGVPPRAGYGAIGQDYYTIEQIYALLMKALLPADATIDSGENLPGYYMFGHSAGAQFTHRFVTFKPESNLLGAVAANAGWYTLPIADGHYGFPYELPRSIVSTASHARLFSAPLTILVGENDTSSPRQDRLVRGTDEAMAQGRNRLERGQNYFNTAARVARQAGVAFNWRLSTVPHARHSAAQMIDSAAYYLFESRDPCTGDGSAPRSSGVLKMQEILIDPPKTMAGDANLDGVRDAQGDEFVRLTNTGQAPICLAGWQLADATKLRHVFPLGTQLQPQESLVIFGGGVPRLHEVELKSQTALFSGSLSLTNAGDVISLRNVFGDIVDSVSWGDCAHKPCAPDAHLGDIGAAHGIARAIASTQRWRPGDVPFSWSIRVKQETLRAEL